MAENLETELDKINKELKKLRVNICFVDDFDNEENNFLKYDSLDKILDEKGNYSLRMEFTNPKSKGDVVVKHNLNYDETLDEISKNFPIDSIAYNSKVFIKENKSLVGMV